MKMITLIWLFLSISISLIQLLVVTQPDWIVNGQNVLVSSFERFTHRKVFFPTNSFQGLFAVCFPSDCVLRPFSSLTAFAAHTLGSACFFLSTVLLCFASCQKNKPHYYEMISYAQIFSGAIDYFFNLIAIFTEFSIDYHCNYYQKCCWIGFEKKNSGNETSAFPIPLFEIPYTFIKISIFAAIMAIGFFAVPLDMSDIDCTIPQLLRSSYCRWIKVCHSC